jgi:hypothetical protein
MTKKPLLTDDKKRFQKPHLIFTPDRRERELAPAFRIYGPRLLWLRRAYPSTTLDKVPVAGKVSYAAEGVKICQVRFGDENSMRESEKNTAPARSS